MSGDVEFKKLAVEKALNELETVLREEIAKKADKDTARAVKESFVSGYNGYVLYTDGYIEQWGLYTGDVVSAGNTERPWSYYTKIALLKEMRDTNYCVTATARNVAFDDNWDFSLHKALHHPFYVPVEWEKYHRIRNQRIVGGEFIDEIYCIRQPLGGLSCLVAHIQRNTVQSAPRIGRHVVEVISHNPHV